MGKAVYVAPPIKTALEPGEKAEVEVKEVRIVKDQWTSIGTLTLGLGIQVEHNGELYSALFSLDRPVLTGSIGRILVSVGIEDTDDPDFEKKIQDLIGKKIRVENRGGKLYWYP